MIIFFLFFLSRKNYAYLHVVTEIFPHCYTGVFQKAILFFVEYRKKDYFYMCAYTGFSFLSLSYIIEIVRG